MLSKTTRIFNSPFHFYFDRNNNFNCFVSFNIYEFLKNSSTYPDIYDVEEFYKGVVDSVKIDFYLVLEDKDSIRLHTEQQIKIDNVQVVSLFNTNKLKTYLLNIDARSINRNYRVKGEISYSDKIYLYIQQFLQGNVANTLFAKDRKTFLDIANTFRNAHEKKYYNTFNTSIPSSTHEFYSEVINFSKKSIKISNLYTIYSPFINRDSLTNFVKTYETIKNVSYDGELPITSFILDNEFYSLDYNLGKKTGDPQNHLKLSMSLLDDSRNRKDYKTYSYQNNLFLVNETTKRKTNETQKSYEYISSIQSSACEDPITKNDKTPELLGSDILLTSAFLDSYPIINFNEYWLGDSKIIPVYLLEILTKYNIMYLTEISEPSLNENWNQLTKEKLENLTSGRYLCLISANQDYIQNNIIENYFVLEV